MSATITQRVIARARSKYGLTVHDHDDWGSRAKATYATRRIHRPVRVRKADTVVQHITVTLDTGPLTGDFHRDVRTVERIGLQRFGSGVSYNWVVDMATGAIAAGMPLDAKGTHTVNDKGVRGYSFDQNHAARAIAVLGMENTPLSAKAAAAIAGLLAAMIDEGAITAGFDYVPHSLFAYKDCPCDATRDKLGSIRRAAIDLRKDTTPDATRLHLMQAGLQFSDRIEERAADVTAIFSRAHDRKVAWVTGTEAQERPTYALVAEAATKTGYRVWRPAATDAWIAVRASFMTSAMTTDWVPVIPRTKQHSERGVVAASFGTELGRTTVLAAHFLTKDRPDAAANDDLAKAIGTYARRVGKGHALAFYGGDQNANDRTSDTFRGGPLTSAWDELGKHENTGYGPIDVIASYDADARVSAAYCWALDDRELHLHSDHYLVEAGYDVLPLRAAS